MKKSAITTYLSELLIVMAGVFLGMLVSNWNATRKLESNRKEIIRSISNELQENKEQIMVFRDRRRLFMSSYDSLYQNLTKEDFKEKFYDRPFEERLPNWSGLGSYKPDDAMFEAAKYGNILIGMEVELLQELSRVYNAQEGAYELQKTFLDRFFSINNETTYGDVNKMVWQVRQELWGNQFLMIEKYDNAIEAINEYLDR